jgi:hypothetical protein
MDILVDVYKDILNFFFEANAKEYSDECGNRTAVIAKRLEAYHQIAAEHGMKTLRIICETTGQYHNKLFSDSPENGPFQRRRVAIDWRRRAISRARRGRRIVRR